MSLLKSIEERSPSPLSEEAGRVARVNGIGIYAAATRIGLEQTPSEEVPEFLRESRREAEVAKLALEAAQAKEDAKLAEFRRYEEKCKCLARELTSIGAGKGMLESAKRDIANFDADFALWPSNTTAGLWERITSNLISEKLVIALPRWIASAEAQAAKLQGEVDKLAKKYAQ